MVAFQQCPHVGRAALAGLIAMLGSYALAAGVETAGRNRASRPLIYVVQLGPGGMPWGLSLGEDRSARVIIKGRDRSIRVGEAAFENLRRLLKSERFADLDESYGTAYVDRDYRVIDAWIDGRRKSVFLYSDLGDDIRREEVARALRVWIAVRDLFEISGAIDTRVADRLLTERKER